MGKVTTVFRNVILVYNINGLISYPMHPLYINIDIMYVLNRFVLESLGTLAQQASCVLNPVSDCVKLFSVFYRPFEPAIFFLFTSGFFFLSFYFQEQFYILPSSGLTGVLVFQSSYFSQWSRQILDFFLRVLFLQYRYFTSRASTQSTKWTEHFSPYFLISIFHLPYICTDPKRKKV